METVTSAWDGYADPGVDESVDSGARTSGSASEPTPVDRSDPVRPKLEPVDPEGGIEQIREILLGDQMATVERRFAALESTLKDRTDRMIRDLEDRFSGTVTGLERRIDDLSRLISSRTEAQSRALRAADERLQAASELLRSTNEGLALEREERRRDLADLEGYVQEQRDRIDNALEVVDERITKGGRQLMKEIIDLRTALNQETSDIRRVTERGFAALSGGAITRAQLAEVFSELARGLANEPPSSS